MPLASMSALLSEARAGGYAVCYCESWNLESFQAVVEAAEEMHAPIIAGFNGGFLGHASRQKPECLSYYAGLAMALRKSATQAAFILNETDDYVQIEEGIEHGFNAVMVENERLGPDEYRKLVKKVVRLAHARNASVEAQVGRLPAGSETGHGIGHATDPKRARAFVEGTGIDALGVAVGNVHILTRGKASIDLERLARIRDAVDLPLVIHGGTGFPQEYARKAIALGVAKFNFGTNLKQTYLAALTGALAKYQEPMDPHPFLGMGGKKDILVAARNTVKNRVKDLLRIFSVRDQKAAAEAL